MAASSGSATSLAIPTSSSEITPEWVQLATGHFAVNEGFHIQAEIQEGIGFMSSMCRVSYKTTDNSSHQIIVKLLPSNPKWLEFTITGGSDEREILFYTKVAPDLVRTVPEIGENLCRIYNGTLCKGDPESGAQRASLLVMEDLVPLGFKMLEFGAPTSDNIIQDVVSFEAKLHFGGHAIQVDKGIPLTELYPFMQCAIGNDDWCDQLIPMMESGFRKFEELAVSNKMTSLWEKFRKLEPLSAKIVRNVDLEGRKNPCMIHADLWPPNILVHESRPVKIIDWQMLAYRDPSFCLCQLLLTLLPKEKFTKETMQSFLKKYFDEFEELCLSRGFGDKIKRRSFGELETFFFTWGIAYGLIICVTFIEAMAERFVEFSYFYHVMCDELQIVEFLERACN